MLEPGSVRELPIVFDRAERDAGERDMAVVDLAEPLDVGAANDLAVVDGASPPDLTVRDLAPVRMCGNGQVESGELCDDGNLVTETSCPYGIATCTRCNADCTAPLNLTGPLCGDGIVNGPEACDDGNTSVCGSCSTNCMTVQSGKAMGRINVVKGSDLVDAETFTLNDGFNPPVTFEFDKNVNTPPHEHSHRALRN
jgi:cysteine-rich repeat protein